MLRFEDCYRILGIEADASAEQIREAYRDLVKVWHPDRFNHDPDLYRKAQDKLKQINEAFETLERRPRPGAGTKSEAPPRRRRPGFHVSNAPRPVVYGRLVYVAFLLMLAGAAGWVLQGDGLSFLMGSRGARKLIDDTLANVNATSGEEERAADAASASPPVDIDEAVRTLSRLAAAEGIEEVLARHQDPPPAPKPVSPDAVIFEWSMSDEEAGPGFQQPEPAPRRSILDDAPEDVAVHLATMTPEQLGSIETACMMSHRRGAEAFERCLEFQLRRTHATRVGLDLTALDAAIRRAIETACADWRYRGPSVYDECLRREHALIASADEASAGPSE